VGSSPTRAISGETMFRLHIDIPLALTEEQAIEATKKIVDLFEKEKMLTFGVEEVNYRLGHDEDRQKSNYLLKNENGHVSNKKSHIHWM
jgi:hypothetical protein